MILGVAPLAEMAEGLPHAVIDLHEDLAPVEVVAHYCSSSAASEQSSGDNLDRYEMCWKRQNWRFSS